MMAEQIQRTQADMRAILDWRGVPSWMQALTMIVAVAAAHDLDRIVGGWTGFLAGLGLALALIGLLPLLWRVSQALRSGLS